MQQQAWTVNLESTKKDLKLWKSKGKKLLYNMLPARIASQIENGAKPNTICEVIITCILSKGIKT